MSGVPICPRALGRAALLLGSCLLSACGDAEVRGLPGRVLSVIVRDDDPADPRTLVDLHYDVDRAGCVTVGPSLHASIQGAPLTLLHRGRNQGDFLRPACDPPAFRGPRRPDETVSRVVVGDATQEVVATVEALYAPRRLEVSGPLRRGERAMLRWTPGHDRLDSPGTVPLWVTVTFEYPDGAHWSLDARALTLGDSQIELTVPAEARRGPGRLRLVGGSGTSDAVLTVFPRVTACEHADRCVISVRQPPPTVAAVVE
ncbi:MAG: hypothetical protein WKG00_04965 [Polyangiaceae bacterium]